LSLVSNLRIYLRFVFVLPVECQVYVRI